MRGALILILGAGLAVAACERARPPSPPARPAPAAAAAARRQVERITGTVTARTAARFAELVSDQEDQIIGLKLDVEPGGDADFKASRYLADVDGDIFVISIGDGGGEGDGTEVVMPKAEASWLHGRYVIDGFYQVKPGGTHQGIVSYGLEKVDPASVLLNAAVTVRDRPLP